jgi:hypothetical protein
MMDADKLVEILERMTLQHSYNCVDAKGRPLKEVRLNTTMTDGEYLEFKELFDE